MTIIDLLIIVLLFGTTQLGFRMGLTRQTGVTAGLIIGLFAAAFMQWQFTQIAPATDNPITQQLYFWLLTGTVLLILALFVDSGLSAGNWLHHKFEKLRRIGFADSIGGAVLAGVTTVVAVWLCSTLFLRTPNQFVANQLRGSIIINSLKQTFPYAPSLFAQASNLLSPNGLPAVFAGNEPGAVASADTSSEVSPQLQEVAAKVAPSVVKITGRGCGGVSTGTGFVVADSTVVTNAHVIAGLPSPYIVDQDGTHAADTLLFDPQLDVAVLRATTLRGHALPINTEYVSPGTGALSFGYASGSLLASSATVQGRQKATGYDIYDAKSAVRTIYTIGGHIENGDSGGPVTDEQGEVIAVIFAKSSSMDGVGYALTADQIADRVHTALTENIIVTNGQCGQE